MATLNKYFWISWDLGLRGEYEALYAWLDNNGAKTCGDNIAWIASYNYDDSEEFHIAVQKELKSTINFKPSDTVYIIFTEQDHASGRYIVGGRKPTSKWAGYGTSTTENTTDGP